MLSLAMAKPYTAHQSGSNALSSPGSRSSWLDKIGGAEWPRRFDRRGISVSGRAKSGFDLFALEDAEEENQCCGTCRGRLRRRSRCVRTRELRAGMPMNIQPTWRRRERMLREFAAMEKDEEESI